MGAATQLFNSGQVTSLNRIADEIIANLSSALDPPNPTTKDEPARRGRHAFQIVPDLRRAAATRVTVALALDKMCFVQPNLSH